jgi:glycosyltransferase involved in cell wall biosynthesis
MKSILLVEHSSKIAGGQVVYLELASAALATGAKTQLAIPTGGRLEAEIVKKFGARVEVIRVPEITMTNGKKSFIDILKLLTSWVLYLPCWMRFRRADIWYVNGGRALIPMAVAALFCRRKLIYHAHLSHGEPGMTSWRMERRLLLMFLKMGIISTVVCPSKFIHDEFEGYSSSFKKPGSCKVIENGLGALYANVVFKDRFCVPHQSVETIGLFGTVSKVKGHQLVCAVAKKFPKITFYCVGGTAPGDEEFVADLQESSPSNLIFLDEVLSVPASIDSLGIQVCLVPSNFEESFGLAAIEGMASSCVTLASKRGALIEISEHTGMLTFSGSGEFEDRIEEISKMSADELSSLAKNQFTRTMRRYSNEGFRNSFSGYFSSC